MLLCFVSDAALSFRLRTLERQSRDVVTRHATALKRKAIDSDGPLTKVQTSSWSLLCRFLSFVIYVLLANLLSTQERKPLPFLPLLLPSLRRPSCRSPLLSLLLLLPRTHIHQLPMQVLQQHMHSFFLQHTHTTPTPPSRARLSQFGSLCNTHARLR